MVYERPAKYCRPPCSTNCVVSLIIFLKEVKTTAQYKLVGHASVGTGKTDMNKNEFYIICHSCSGVAHIFGVCGHTESDI
jgi:hypothetical protein